MNFSTLNHDRRRGQELRTSDRYPSIGAELVFRAKVKRAATLKTFETGRIMRDAIQCILPQTANFRPSGHYSYKSCVGQHSKRNYKEARLEIIEAWNY